MARWERFIRSAGPLRMITVLGGLFVVLSAGRAIQVLTMGEPLVEALVEFILIGIPGVALLYARYWLPRTEIRQEIYPRIVVWCLSGLGMMVGVVGLLVLEPVRSIDQPYWAGTIAAALGSVGGLGIGINNGRAFSRAHEAEQRSQALQRYETLFEETTDVNAVLDTDASFEYLTPSVERVLGYAPEELLGDVAFEYMHPDDREEAMDAFAEMLDTGERSRTVVFRFKHADGGWVVLEGRGRNLLDDPLINGIVAYTHDVTERERLEDDLRRERDLRERIVETSPIGISVINADRSTRMVNDHAADIVGLSRDELLEIEYDESVFETADADENPLEDGIFQQVLTTGDPVYDRERQMTRPDGRRIWLSVSGAPLHDSAGEITAVIFAFEDITDRKQLERYLQGTVDRLEQSNDRLRQFAYAASHDLQEPLRMVSSYLQLIENRYEDDLGSDVLEFIDFAVNGADRMRQMINDLLAFSRLEETNPQFDAVDCNTVVEEVLTDLHVRIEETDASIDTGTLPTIHADEKQLKQLFQNLVSNALKYSTDEAPRVEIAVEEQNDRWKFSVADNGIGIEPERTDQIFQVFNRLHSDEDYSGTGIGLSLCERIVEHHDGRIWVESEPDEGSTFYFTLPSKHHREQRTIPD